MYAKNSKKFENCVGFSTSRSERDLINSFYFLRNGQILDFSVSAKMYSFFLEKLHKCPFKGTYSKSITLLNNTVLSFISIIRFISL